MQFAKLKSSRFFCVTLLSFRRHAVLLLARVARDLGRDGVRGVRHDAADRMDAKGATQGNLNKNKKSP